MRWGSRRFSIIYNSLSEQIRSISVTILHQSHFREETRGNIRLIVAIDVTSEFETEAEKTSRNYFLVSPRLFDKSDRSRITLTRVKKYKKQKNPKKSKKLLIEKVYLRMINVYFGKANM